MTGSRRLRFADAISIFARSTRSPFLNSPARIRANNSAFSFTLRSRNGLFRPGLVNVPLPSLISCADWFVHVGLADADEMAGPRVELLEVVGGEVEALRPIESEPLDVTLDRVDVLYPLVCRVRIVEAQVATAAEFLRKLVIQHDRLRVAQVEEAVRLGWKARDRDTRAAGLDVRRYDAANEIAGACARFSDVVLLRHLPASSLEFIGRVRAEAAHPERAPS